MEEEKLVLKVNTGAVQYRIEDENGEKIGTLTFNPSDTGMLTRYNSVIDFLSNVKFDDTASDEMKIEEIKKIEDGIAEQIDFLLGYKNADELFAKCKPLTPLQNGEFYFENVISAIGTLIEKATNQRVKKRIAKIEKGVEKYK